MDELTEGETVALGIRPEHFVLDSDDPLFEASIEVVEPHGTNDAIFLSAGDSASRSGSIEADRRPGLFADFSA